MVQLASVAVINSSDDVALTSTGETAEAQEARIHHLYDSALQAQRKGEPAQAAVALVLFYAAVLHTVIGRLLQRQGYVLCRCCSSSSSLSLHFSCNRTRPKIHLHWPIKCGA